MAGKTAAWALAGILLVIGSASFAQEFDGDCGHGHRCHHRNRRSCCPRLFAWWTYRPLPVPHDQKAFIRFQQTPQPPYYAYFVYLYGPRSPALGFKPTPVHHGSICAHGLPPDGIPDASSADIPMPVPEEMLPTPKLKNGAPATPESGTLPNEAPEESEQTLQGGVTPSTAVPIREVTGIPQR